MTMQANGPDYSQVTSREAARGLVERGELVVMYLLPEMFGGDDGHQNVVYVPPYAAEQKRRLDETVIRPMVAAGRVIEYHAEPVHAGDCFVPLSIRVTAHDPNAHAFGPGQVLQIIKI